LRPSTFVIGLTVPRDVLQERLARRVDQMVRMGLIDEVRTLYEKYGDIEALQAPGYKAFAAFVSGFIGLDEAKRQFVQGDLGLAKRQRTWFRRNPAIHWLSYDIASQQAIPLVASFLETPVY
jgi:tRNA dimethylallyltransferase